MAPLLNTHTGTTASGEFRPAGSNSQEPLALETTVTVTGARPSEAGSKRDLFTEETKTVLVFENGAVIRLSAAVADGQLLFLSNKKTGKEVVAQAIRKRSFRPTNCYVDLEFTEPCPGFWGVEFPKPGTAASVVSAAKKFSDEEADVVALTAASAPSTQEVERLKHEVAELQVQLKSLLQAPSPSSIPAMRAGAPNVPPPQPGEKAALEIRAHIAKKEVEQQLDELIAQEKKQDQEQAEAGAVQSSPKKLRTNANITITAAPKENVQPSAVKRWMIAGAAGILLAAGIGGAYQFGLLDGLGQIVGAPKQLPHSPAGPVATNTQKTVSAKAAPAPSASSPETGGLVATAQPSSPPDTSGKIAKNDTEANALASSETKDLSENVAPAKPSSLASRMAAYFSNHKTSSKKPSNDGVATASSATSGSKPSKIATNPTSTDNAEASSGIGNDDFTEPKLVKSVKPVAPAEATKNYVTGNVNMDALVDSTGHVKSVTVLSGPEKLRSAAISSVKQYVYEPATKSGKAVSAHVQVSLQFWYEP